MNLFAMAVIAALQKVRVQKTVADLRKTTAYIVRSIIIDTVEKGLEKLCTTTLVWYL